MQACVYNLHTPGNPVTPNLLICKTTEDKYSTKIEVNVIRYFHLNKFKYTPMGAYLNYLMGTFSGQPGKPAPER